VCRRSTKRRRSLASSLRPAAGTSPSSLVRTALTGPLCTAVHCVRCTCARAALASSCAGSVDAIRQVVAIAEAHPHAPIILQVRMW
jgi:hypothetical protein